LWKEEGNPQKQPDPWKYQVLRLQTGGFHPRIEQKVMAAYSLREMEENEAALQQSKHERLSLVWCRGNKGV